MSKIKLCEACSETFLWDDDVIIIDDKVYHKDCVSLYPTGYVAFIDDNFLGETENDDGGMAFDWLEKGEYEDDE